MPCISGTWVFDWVFPPNFAAAIPSWSIEASTFMPLCHYCNSSVYESDAVCGICGVELWQLHVSRPAARFLGMEVGRFRLPHRKADRIGLAFVCIVLMPIAVLVQYLIWKEWDLPGEWAWAIKALAAETCLLLLLISALGFIWAIATPRWLEQFLENSAMKLVVIIAVTSVLFAIASQL